MDPLVAEHNARMATSSDAQPSSVFSPKSSQVQYSDRYIPCRNTSKHLSYSLAERPGGAWDSNRLADRDDSAQAYNTMLRSELLGMPPAGPGSPERGAPASLSPVTSPARKILRFKTGDRHSPIAGGEVESPYNTAAIGQDEIGLISPKIMHRKIPKSPFKGGKNAWARQECDDNLDEGEARASNFTKCVQVNKLCDLSPEGTTDAAQDTVCSVAWSQRGTYLSIGSNDGYVYIWDIARVKMVRRMEGHGARVGTMAWNSHMLSTGGRDRLILNRDIRAPEDVVHTMSGHRSEVCGLKWSPDDRELASGGNDNQLNIWKANITTPVIRFQDHHAAVKAISWSPHQQGLVASGGGTADRCIRFWSTTTATPLQAIDTGSQVCNLAWSKNVNEIVSTHGYSQNQVVVWKYPSMTKISTLTGHSSRVLYLSLSPDGQTVVTGAGDETLRFWNIFPSPRAHSTSSSTEMGAMMRTQIR